MDDEKLERYRKRVQRWRQLYPIAPREYDPSQVKAILRCAKCGSINNITRHHRGHEYLFALIMPNVYAARYIRFEPNDWIPLCTEGLKCHQEIHKIYEPIVKDFLSYVSDRTKRVTHDIHDLPDIEWIFRPNRKVLESYRQRLIACCNEWIARKNRKRKRKYKDYREHTGF